MYLWFAFLILLIFIYNFYSKLRSRHTVGLHRNPANVRRSHRESVTYHNVSIEEEIRSYSWKWDDSLPKRQDLPL